MTIHLSEIENTKGIVLRFVPLTHRSIYERRHFKDGDKIEYLERFKREMTIRTTPNKLGGKWLATYQSDESVTTPWLTGFFAIGDDPESAIAALNVGDLYYGITGPGET